MKSTREVSDKMEKRVAKTIGGRVQCGSGSTPFLKGDVVRDGWLIECKTKMKPSQAHSIRKEWLDKAREQMFATRMSNYAVVFDFGDEGRQYAIIDLETFRDLIDDSEK